MDQKQSKAYALALLGALSADHVETVIKGNEGARYWFDTPQNWISYGGRAKNWDTVGNQQTNPVGALVELVTNGIDAILLRKARESGIEDPRSAKAPQSMFEAVKQFFPGIVEGKIANLEPAQRTKLAEQCMLIGVKRADRTNSRYPTYTLIDFGGGQKAVTVEETISHLPALAAGEIHPTIRNHRARALSDLNLKRIASVRPGESNHGLRDTPYGDLSLGCHRRLKDRSGQQSFSDTYTRMRGGDVAPTITTKCISITNGRFGHYDTDQNRGITPREAALMQTFPENYVFSPEDNIHFTATLIGNAVPPKLARFFGKFIAQRIVGK